MDLSIFQFMNMSSALEGCEQHVGCEHGHEEIHRLCRSIANFCHLLWRSVYRPWARPRTQRRKIASDRPKPICGVGQMRPMPSVTLRWLERFRAQQDDPDPKNRRPRTDCLRRFQQAESAATI